MTDAQAGGAPIAARRIGRWGLVAGGVVVATRLAPQWPKDQTMHYVLGDAAPRVQEIDARWVPGTGEVAAGGQHEPATDDWARGARFHFAEGAAPRVVTHQPRLADGEYTVEIELVTFSSSPAAAPGRAIVRRHVTLAGGVTSIELAPAVPQ